MSKTAKLIRCEDVAPLLVFYACDELTSDECKQIAAHLEGCAECRAQLAEENDFRAAMEGMPQAADQFDSSGVLLSQCRSELSESLDQLSAPKIEEGWQAFGWVRGWMALRPGWSAAALLLAGAIVGTQAIQWLPFNTGNGTGSALNVLAAPKISNDQLSKMDVASINFSRPTGKVQIQLQAEQPMTLTSDDDDADVRRVLTFVISNSDRFDAGVRLDCVEALHASAMDEQVRNALLAAARRDQNPAVRLKSLDALRDMAGLPAVREVLMESLQHDSNSGVRVEAINLLVRTLESGDEMPELAPVAPDSDSSWQEVAPQPLRASGKESEQHDSNRYVRLRSAAALRQLARQDLQ
jgi:hypothetical protein